MFLGVDKLINQWTYLSVFPTGEIHLLCVDTDDQYMSIYGSADICDISATISQSWLNSTHAIFYDGTDEMLGMAIFGMIC